MATSTLIQFLGDTVTDPSGIAGDTSHRRQTETFIAGGTVAALDWVAVDASKTGADRLLYITQAAAVANGNGQVIGVALNGGAAGEQIRVVTSGYVEGANVAAAVTAGQPLVVDNTLAGRAVAYAAADLAPPCGVALENADAGNTCDVLVYKLF